MSIWGAGPFQNDDAADWLSELEEDPRLELVQKALSEVVDAADVGYVEIPECCAAGAAAEVLAELLGMPGKESLLEEETVEKLKGELDRLSVREKRKLMAQALVAVEVLNDEESSELRQVMEQDEELVADWTTAMKNLESRLQIIASGLR